MKVPASTHGWSKGWRLAPWLLALAASPPFNVAGHSLHSYEYVPFIFLLPGFFLPGSLGIWLQYLLMVGMLFGVIGAVRHLMRDRSTIPGLVGFALLVPPVLVNALWKYEFDHHSTPEARRAAFLNLMPAVLRDHQILAQGIVFVSAVAAVGFLGVAFARSTGVWRFITVCGVIVAVLLSLLGRVQAM